MLYGQSRWVIQSVVVAALMTESGRVKKGDKLLLMPNKTDVEISGIYTEQADEMEQAFAGDNVRLRLKGINDEDIQPGPSAITPVRSWLTGRIRSHFHGRSRQGRDSNPSRSQCYRCQEHHRQW